MPSRAPRRKNFWGKSRGKANIEVARYLPSARQVQTAGAGDLCDGGAPSLKGPSAKGSPDTQARSGPHCGRVYNIGSDGTDAAPLDEIKVHAVDLVALGGAQLFERATVT